MAKKTLLEKALAHPRAQAANAATEDRIDLALAYCAREISLDQAGAALGTKNGGATRSAMAQTLIGAARAGLIELTKVEK
jgi:hypothetical protein